MIATRLASTMGNIYQVQFARQIGQRCMSVINLSDFEATEKFREVNRKSVLYFTAVW